MRILLGFVLLALPFSVTASPRLADRLPNEARCRGGLDLRAATANEAFDVVAWGRIPALADIATAVSQMEDAGLVLSSGLERIAFAWPPTGRGRPCVVGDGSFDRSAVEADCLANGAEREELEPGLEVLRLSTPAHSSPLYLSFPGGLALVAPGGETRRLNGLPTPGAPTPALDVVPDSATMWLLLDGREAARRLGLDGSLGMSQFDSVVAWSAPSVGGELTVHLEARADSPLVAASMSRVLRAILAGGSSLASSLPGLAALTATAEVDSVGERLVTRATLTEADARALVAARDPGPDSDFPLPLPGEEGGRP